MERKKSRLQHLASFGGCLGGCTIGDTSGLSSVRASNILDRVVWEEEPASRRLSCGRLLAQLLVALPAGPPARELPGLRDTSGCAAPLDADPPRELRLAAFPKIRRKK